MALPGHAAEIVAGRTTITLTGLIGPGDAEAFKLKAELFPDNATAVLNSPGGNLLAALAIGDFIRLRGWSTYVSGECDSACALIWLGGSPRMMTPDARIGFHAASVDGQETGLGNVVLGEYLHRIGLNNEAVTYATKAGPYTMTYLTPGEAKRVGIEVSVVSRAAGGPIEPPSGQSAFAPTAAARQPSVPAAQSARSQAESEASFLVRYLFSNSSNNAKTLAAAYWDNVFYHGRMTSVIDVLADKQRFFAKWPTRSYTIRSMNPAYCRGNDGIITKCQVSGIVDWEASSPTKKAVGSATFEYVLSPWPLGSWSIREGGQVGLRIVAEDGKALRSHVIDLADQLASKSRHGT